MDDGYVGRGCADDRGHDDRCRHDSRHRGVHGARTGARPERGQARRHLGVRCDPLRDAHWRADVRGRDGHRRARVGRASGSGSEARAGESAAAAPAMSREGSEAASARRRRRDAPARHRARGGCGGRAVQQDAAPGAWRRRCAAGTCARRRVVRPLPRDTAGRRTHAVPDGAAQQRELHAVRHIGDLA